MLTFQNNSIIIFFRDIFFASDKSEESCVNSDVDLLKAVNLRKTMLNDYSNDDNYLND